MSYAVIKTGGKQYRVSPGTTLTIEKLPGQVGDSVSFDQVLMAGGADGIRVGRPLVEGASVSGVILRQDRGPRILVYKKKKRKNYRRRQGHRQWETTVQVTEIA
jgi:large subunit ribosomal protein L21